MAQPYPTKDIVNALYHSAVETGLIVAYSVLGKKLIKLDVGDPAKADFTEGMKLVAVVTLSVITKEYLIKMKIIPDDIYPSA